MLDKINTRKALYEIAWRKPISRIVEEYGVTYRDFKKLCDDNQIPLPENGYWSKLKFGKPVVRVELPIGISENIKIELRVSKQAKEIQNVKSKFKNPRQIHPLVVKTKKYLINTNSYRASVFQAQHPKNLEILPIQTDSKLQKRALSFMNLLLSHMEERGMSIVFEYQGCYAELYNQTIKINLRQKYHRVKILDELSWPYQEYVKSEKLEFQIGSHAPKNWLDTNRRIIEERIPEILDNVEENLTYWRDIRKQQAIDEEKRRILEEKEKDIAREKALEQEKKTELFINAKNWKKAKNLRKYIKRVEEKESVNNQFDAKTIEWINWANEKADEIDPLT
ncbi:hypothetical protein [Cellulophaga sp. L1A9]|uniref:hypothetical protein n=1 Tax=Cellulophaga sp. L1A9 TaxID=2686362 RepID=UPI001E5C1C1B|nr:hypothetical protein [Cellulophaga sp. L1A9]